eukprot:PITA_21914
MQKISTGLPKGKLEQFDTCKGCTLGKYTMSSFHDRDSQAEAILEQVHTDLCGPFSTESTLKQRYYVIFIDDYSHKCLIYFMQKKDQTFTKFCEFKALVEKESGKKIKATRSNNGGEYVSQRFKDFFASEGIKRELMAPHNQQQNGVVERKNRTIVGAAQEMLHDQGLPLHLWAEACNTAVYLQNRSPHHILGMKTPEEVFSGCTEELRIFVGYTDTPQNYWVYFPTSRSTVVRRDLKFDEQKAMRVSLERELQLQAVEELLVPKEEKPQTNAKQPHAEVPGAETSTQAESSRDGWKRTREGDRLSEDVRENVGAPSSQCRERRSPKRYTGYMALAGECVETEPYSFEEAMQQSIWVDAMVEEYDSIVRISVWDVVPRLENKSVVSSHWLYKVKKVVDGSVEKHKARFVARGFS